MNDFSVSGYLRFINSFKDAGYRFRKFGIEQDADRKQPTIILRHDVDFSLEAALAMAQVDAAQKVSATYFFELRSPLYNLLSAYCHGVLSKIVELGHDVGLHAEIREGNGNQLSHVRDDFEIFRQFFPAANAQFVSFHRVGSRLPVLRDLRLEGFRHTYESEFVEEMAYFSDSKCSWAFGHPLYSSEFQQRHNFHILIHPVWWMLGGTGIGGKLKKLVNGNRYYCVTNMQEHVFSFDIQAHFKHLSRKVPYEPDQH